MLSQKYEFYITFFLYYYYGKSIKIDIKNTKSYTSYY